MRQLNCDSLPHLTECLFRFFRIQWDTLRTRLTALWWGVRLGSGCSFNGVPLFRRHPGSLITIGDGCKFNSSPTSNLIGLNHPCIVATLKEGAQIRIGANCGFSGTVIGCASSIDIGENVRCGANTLINDTDWHPEDPRSGPDAPVIIERGVWLGGNVTVFKGVTIGENTFVAAGSMVTRSLPANAVAGGIPAMVFKRVEARQPGARL